MAHASHRIHVTRSLPFFAFHVLALGVFFFPFRWELLALCVGSYYLRMFAITAGFHRYFSHRTYKTSRAFQFFMAFLGQTSVQKGALWWAAHHRHHHKSSDQADDIHSPLQDGFWWSHVGWILSSRYDDTQWDQISDLRKFPELVWLNRYPHIAVAVYAVAIYALAGWAGVFWGFFLSTVLLWHGTFTINSLSHVFGRRRYVTTDTSKNNFWLSLITMGEGWHNNHHCYQAAAKQGFFWWEIDMSYYVLKAMSFVGIARDLKQPPLALLEKKRISA